MIPISLPMGQIALTLSQLLILRRVYQESKKHPMTFTLEAGFVDWDVLVAYRLLERLTVSDECFDYRITPLGNTFMKALEV